MKKEFILKNHAILPKLAAAFPDRNWQKWSG
jgi:hypothetical protein